MSRALYMTYDPDARHACEGVTATGLPCRRIARVRFEWADRPSVFLCGIHSRGVEPISGTESTRCPECQSPVTDPVTLFGVHTASCAVVMCQCEHEEHERGGKAHRYLGVRAGTQRALHVGRICDSCAGSHLADYLLAEGGLEQVNRMTGHDLQAPSESDLRWTCSGCSWTASDAFTSPEERGSMFAAHQER